MHRHVSFFAALFALSALPLALLYSGDQRKPGASPLFSSVMMRVEQERWRAITAHLLDSNRPQEAVEPLGRLLSLEPLEPRDWILRARVYAALHDHDLVVNSIRRGISAGLNSAEILDDDRMIRAILTEDERKELTGEISRRSAAQKPSRPAFIPGEIRDGVALVTEQDTHWVPERLSLITSFRPVPVSPESSSPQSGSAAAPPAADLSPEQIVERWITEGTAAGYSGLLYDNRDRGHSSLNVSRFPGLVRVTYAPDIRAAEADRSLRNQQAFDWPTFGNSSTALVGSPYWRSNPRLILNDQLQMRVAELHFLNSQLYCYPEHNDFDPEHGDVYPANAPFWVISQGSSGSDQPFLRAIALTLASFRPDVRQRLIETGQLMPMVQILLRRSQKSVTTDEQYFTGAAHPVVFQSSELDPQRMITLAHELTPETLPAVTRIRVVREDEGVPGRDYFHPDAAEQLFDTQSVIARVYRTTAARRRMVLDVSGSADPNGRPLTFRWAVLQGDAESIRIEPLNVSGSRVSVSIPWHPRSAIPGRPELLTSRVDLGVFALNGTTVPLPAMICSYSLANEEREYFPDGRIRAVVYRTPNEGAAYVDPTIDIAKSWRDDYHYDDRNRLTGWTRTRSTGNAEEFAADGRLIIRRDESGDPAEYRSVRYDIDTAPDQVRTLREVILPAR